MVKLVIGRNCLLYTSREGDDPHHGTARTGRRELQRKVLHLPFQLPGRGRSYAAGRRGAFPAQDVYKRQTYDAMCAHAQREADQGVAGFDAMNEK